MGASITPTLENLISCNKILLQPLLDCGQDKINSHNNKCGNCPATRLGPEEDGGDVGSGLARGPGGVASNRDEESMEINDNKKSRAIDRFDNLIAWALHPINNMDCIRPSNSSLQTNGV
jgi:hypothetical protein